MRTNTILFTGAAIATVIALAACNKPADNSATPTASDAASAAATPLASDAAAPAAMPTDTAGFVTAAATTDMYEIAAARIALAKSHDPEVKKFAQRMIHDHSATTAKLKKLIADKKVSATPPADMDARQKGMIDKLNAAAPADFDKTYIGQQIAVHDEALGVFKGFAAGGDNDALKTFASSTAPTIQDHDDMAHKIQTGLK
ncbi:MAG TPA: DUF4142 domain-containing protein [Caulobacteraceae bacterium]|nr:DUF4142 domain-containing protein [Caulobacteraceae bacterium]